MGPCDGGALAALPSIHTPNPLGIFHINIYGNLHCHSKCQDLEEMISLFPPPSPNLPSFQTLLIQGPYHASAPLHLCLSHARQHSPTKIILTSPSRDEFKSTMQAFNDNWLNIHGGDGLTSGAASQVQVLLVFLPISQVSRNLNAHMQLPAYVCSSHPLAFHVP